MAVTLVLFATLATACTRGGAANGTIDVSIVSSTSGESAERTLEISSCNLGALRAGPPGGTGWSAGLDVEEGEQLVSVVITSPDTGQLIGSLTEMVSMDPHLPGTGTAILHPEDDPEGAEYIAELTWDCPA
jgi:hypothetical protein